MKFFKYLKERWEECDWEGRTYLTLGWLACLGVVVCLGVVTYLAWPVMLFIASVLVGFGLVVLAVAALTDYADYKRSGRKYK